MKKLLTAVIMAAAMASFAEEYESPVTGQRASVGRRPLLNEGGLLPSKGTSPCIAEGEVFHLSP